MNWKKVIVSLSIVCLGISGCARKEQPLSSTRDIKIVSTIYPQYDWINQIIGDRSKIENDYLLDRGIDLHSFQPSAADINEILTSDIFVYVGGESDEWVKSVLAQDTKHSVLAVNLLELVEDNLKQEEYVEGMQMETADFECDEHIWLSLHNAEIITNELTQIICEQDAENSKYYQDNASTYIEKLHELDLEYQQMVEQAKYNTIVVADRFPFRYLVDDYGIEYYAAFAGCSAETEASFDTIITLSKKVDEFELSNIIVTEGTDQKLAKTVIDHTADKNQAIVIMNSIQSVNRTTSNNSSFLEMMKENLNSLRIALGENH